MTLKRAIAGISFICVVLLLGSACAPKAKRLTLAQSVQIFNDALRWNRYQEAAGFVVPMDRVDFARDQAEIGESRRIMEYRVQEMSRQDEKTVLAVVRWEYTNLNSPIVVKERMMQTWTQVGDDWFLLRMAPEKKAPKKPEKSGPAIGRN